MTKYLLIAIIFIAPIFTYAQGGIIMRQFFKPGLKVSAEAMPQTTDSYTGKLRLYNGRAGLVIPIKSKLGVKFKPKELMKLENLKELKNIKDWKTIPKLAMKVVEPDAYQIFMNLNAGYTVMDGNRRVRDFYPNYDTTTYNMYKFSAGVTGIHYRKKMRILFYSGDIGFVETKESFPSFHPNINALVGMGKIQSPFKFNYYGLYLGYANGKIIPVPFVGVDLRLANKARLNVTLPVQLKLSFKANRKTRYALLAQYTGFAGAWGVSEPYNTRQHLNHSYLKTTGILERKLSKEVKLFVEAGWSHARRESWYAGIKLLDRKITKIYRYPGAPYVNVSIYRSFGKSLFDSGIGNLLNF